MCVFELREWEKKKRQSQSEVRKGGVVAVGKGTGRGDEAEGCSE